MHTDANGRPILARDYGQTIHAGPGSPVYRVDERIMYHGRPCLKLHCIGGTHPDVSPYPAHCFVVQGHYG